MTEREWLTSADPSAMLDCLISGDKARVGVSDRKLRLFACACRRLTNLPWIEDGCWSMMEEDGQPTDGWTAKSRAELFLTRGQKHPRQADLLRDIFGNPWRLVTLCGVEQFPHSTRQSQKATIGTDGWNGCILCLKVHRNAIVQSLAEGIYCDRAFNRMPILADALEEARCREEAILRHLRGHKRRDKCLGEGFYWEKLPAEVRRYHLHPGCEKCITEGWIADAGPRVRGDWVIDLLLGKK